LREKIARKGWVKEVVYTKERWELLREKRKLALPVLEIANAISSSSMLHGSVARGDVEVTSDIDVIIPDPIPPFLIEVKLEERGMKYYDRYIVQATPSSTPKIYYSLEPTGLITISYPLAKLSIKEYEFYKFGGWLDLKGLRKGLRVPGVDKRLVLITPTDYGHKEESILGKEEEVAELLGISIETVKEREYVLLRRDKHGRTGVFLGYHIPPSESTSNAIMKLKERNKFFRKALDKLS